MAVTILLSDGSQRRVNGRNGIILEWWAKHAADLDRYERLKVEVSCAGPKVVIKPQPDLSEALSTPND